MPDPENPDDRGSGDYTSYVVMVQFEGSGKSTGNSITKGESTNPTVRKLQRNNPRESPRTVAKPKRQLTDAQKQAKRARAKKRRENKKGTGLV